MVLVEMRPDLAGFWVRSCHLVTLRSDRPFARRTSIARAMVAVSRGEQVCVCMKGLALRRVGMRVTAQAGSQQALRDPVAQVPAVKPVGVFLQVELASGASVIGAVNKGLGQADDGVHPGGRPPVPRGHYYASRGGLLDAPSPPPRRWQPRRSAKPHNLRPA